MADSSAPTTLPEPGGRGADGLLPAEIRAWMHLLAAAGAVEQKLHTQLKRALGVSHDEFLVLCLLADQPGAGLRMTRIAELLGRPKTRLTYQVACLEHAGLVTRRATCGDKRGIDVALTGKGRRLLREASPPLADTITQAAVDALGPEQREALRRLLEGTEDADR